MTRVDSSFFNVSCEDLAKNLLNSVLVRRLHDGTILKGKIVETECYLGNDDKASHSYGGKQTSRNEPMYMDAGTVYVYQTYGMYHCINISSKEPGAAVLIRAIEPIEGDLIMTEHRLNHRARKKNNKNSPKDSKTQLKKYQLCNGPSKLCISFDINIINCNKLNMKDSNCIWIENRAEEICNNEIIRTTRIGIESAGEWAKKLLRFYVRNTSVSVRDRKSENN